MSDIFSKRLGRPPGRKDGPRAPGARPRGRPKHSDQQPEASGSTAPARDTSAAEDLDGDGDDEFDGQFSDFDDDFFEELDRTDQVNLSKAEADRLARAAKCQQEEEARRRRLRELEKARDNPQTLPFFNHLPGFSHSQNGADSDTDALDSQNEDETPKVQAKEDSGEANDAGQAWFPKPKSMSSWLYIFFRDVVQPISHHKDNKSYIKHPLFTQNKPHTPPSLWIHPPDPLHSLNNHKFDPTLLYRPRVYLWLVHHFVPKLLCPRCKKPLEKNGALPPRRIFDEDGYYFIVSWAYYCRGGCKKHFHGWSKELVDSLPRKLRLSFPAILSRKCGIDEKFMSLMRVSNQHKMGPAGIRSLMYELHTRRFNKLALQYLEAVFERVQTGLQIKSGNSQSQLTEHFAHTHVPSFGNFGDKEGYGGYVPTDRYLSAMMNKAIERDEAAANQHTALVNMDSIACDDSYKIVKHMIEEDGVPVLTITKSHEERLGSLKGIADSGHRYGHNNPTHAYSDDPVKDKKLLYAAFPSLAQNLTPIAAARGLKAFEIPSDAKTLVLSTAEQVDLALSPLIELIDESPSASLCLSLDAEWNIKRSVGVSILQILSHLDSTAIYIVPIHSFPRIPVSLLRLLLAERVFKIGSGVKGDLTRLSKQFPQQLQKAVFSTIDLKDYAIQRRIIGREDKGSLAALAETVLGVYLPKDDDVRQSDDWELRPIRSELLKYAALDVLASRQIFEKLSETRAVTGVDRTTPGGTRIALLVQPGGAIIAYGQVLAEQPSKYGDIRIDIPSQSRLVVEIDDVLCTAAALPLHKIPDALVGESSDALSTAGRRVKAGCRTLGELQSASPTSPTFCVVAQLSHLIFDRREQLPALNSPLLQSSAAESSRSHPYDAAGATETLISEAESDIGDLDPDAEAQPVQLNWNTAEDTGRQLEIQMLEANTALTRNTTSNQKRKRNSTEITSDGVSNFLDFAEALRRLIESPPDSDAEFQRVLKDIFHAFHMIVVPTNHVLRDKVDKACRRFFNLTFDEMLTRYPRFIAARVPRHIPAPSILSKSLEFVFSTFGNSIDAKTGAPLFNKLAWQKATAVLELAREGYLSDIPGVVHYEKAGVDQYGLQKWICLRGTNKVEGGPHADIYRKFGALHGYRHTVNCLNDHRTWYNLQAYAKHVVGTDWHYHHDLALINRTSFLLNFLSDVHAGADSYADWVNGDLYEQTTETFGICKFPKSLRIRMGMKQYSPEVAATFKLNASDDWLRRRQDLALPVRTPSQSNARQYFFTRRRELSMTAAAEGSPSTKINYEAFAVEWNTTADGKSRFYVTTEILVNYAKTWERSSNVKASQEMMAEQLKDIRRSAQIFAASDLPFPSFMTGEATEIRPTRGIRELNAESNLASSSIGTDLSMQLATMDLETDPVPARVQDTAPTMMLDQDEAQMPVDFQTTGDDLDWDDSGRGAQSTSSSKFPQSVLVSSASGSGPQGVPGAVDAGFSQPYESLHPISMRSHPAPSPPVASDEAPSHEFGLASHSDSGTQKLSAQAAGNAAEGPEKKRRRREVAQENRQRRTRTCRRCNSPLCPGQNGVQRCLLPCIPCLMCGKGDVECPTGSDGGRNCKVNGGKWISKKR
ncbi:hypothetical protein BDZ89DRAFT_1112967 [Hymenopellis radicata]|nr:hypothetical protein BDZ89DRAFT_1112967 [Hymenopellis radicata]